MRQIPGVHHVTAIAGDPQQNLDFYSGLLGLRLVKQTVNFDDPATYHFYFGDHQGRPGTLLTFFPWPRAPRGRRGTGQTTAVSFSIAEGAMGYWIERLKSRDLAIDGPKRRFDEETIAFQDPDGLRLELVANADTRAGWAEGPVPAAHAIRGVHSVTLSEEEHQQTAALIVGALGFRRAKVIGNRIRYESGDGGAGAIVDVEAVPGLAPGRVAVGTVHHVAWCTPSDAEQAEWRADLVGRGIDVTEIIDRVYFHSIYFREPGGVLFEIATLPPGFAVDEPLAQLGARLVLPAWLEPRRMDLEAHLPPVRTTQLARGA